MLRKYVERYTRVRTSWVPSPIMDRPRRLRLLKADGLPLDIMFTLTDSLVQQSGMGEASAARVELSTSGSGARDADGSGPLARAGSGSGNPAGGGVPVRFFGVITQPPSKGNCRRQ